MEHSACMEELDEVERWMSQRLPQLGPVEDRSEL
jgi:hypothetical protein